jgi:hypothetical protein
MAGEGHPFPVSPLESRLRQLAAALDARALEALASKGLLRRAAKDLERGIPTRVAGETQKTLSVAVGPFEVTLSESGPAAARCSCPAGGVCQHILTAVLFLQQAAPPGTEEPSPAPAPTAPPSPAREQLLALGLEDLERWAGKAAFRAGLKLGCQWTPEVVHGRTVRIRFSDLNWEAHFLPEAGLDGMIVSGGKGDVRSLVVAAVIGFQRREGKSWTPPEQPSALAASTGAPRTRPEVLESCQRLLAESLANGLSRLAPPNRERWATLAVSALGVNLPRLALLLRGIADEAALVVARDARSDLSRMLGRMAQTHALCTALENGGDQPRPDLVGWHRTQYEDVGRLDLMGAAAWPWRTASGYEGLTLLFWEPAAREWNSWTDSRPRLQAAGFTPAGRYRDLGPWEGADSPRQLSRSSFRLANARRNRARRLSGSGRSRVLVTGPSRLRAQDLPVSEAWDELLERWKTRTAVGLREANSLDWIFALKPATWAARGFDPVTQVFRWVLEDAEGHPLPLELPFEELTEPAMRYLEQVSAASVRDALVIGRIQRASHGLSLLPFSLHRTDGECTHLCLDPAPASAANPAGPAEAGDDAFEEEEDLPSAGIGPALGHLWNEVDDALLALAEAGLAAPHPLRIETVRQAAPRAERLGLEALAASLAHVALVPQPHSLLRCAYVVGLHRQAAPLAM